MKAGSQAPDSGLVAIAWLNWFVFPWWSHACGPPVRGCIALLSCVSRGPRNRPVCGPHGKRETVCASDFILVGCPAVTGGGGPVSEEGQGGTSGDRGSSLGGDALRAAPRLTLFLVPFHDACRMTHDAWRMTHEYAVGFC